MAYLSFNHSPRKYYRWFRGHTHGQLGCWFKPQSYITTGFALIPMKVDGQWTWLRSYFVLKTIGSAFSFGGTTTVSYKTTQRSFSVFTFKKALKKEGAIKNLYKDKIETKKKMDAWPDWFKKAVAKSQRHNQ